MELLSGAAPAIRALRHAGYAVVVITNQTCVGLGYASSEMVDAVHDRMAELLGDEAAGVDAIYASRDAGHNAIHPSLAGADPSFEEYPRAEVLESAQALTVVPVARDIGPPGPRHLVVVGHRREVEVQLAQPLGARVLVDLDGSAAEVTLS